MKELTSLQQTRMSLLKVSEQELSRSQREAVAVTLQYIDHKIDQLQKQILNKLHR
tara:strand:+ start:299 stop:463 length:165 start_codon:yes stop_codon:yes gene_type:complete